MCCRRNQPNYLLQAGPPSQTRQLSKCAARRQQRRELRALAVNSLPVLEKELGLRQITSQIHWTEYQPRTMAGILVMGVALGLQEGGKKIKEKRDERKAKKAALVGFGLNIQSCNDTNPCERQLKCMNQQSPLPPGLCEAATHAGNRKRRGRARKPEESNSAAALAPRDSTKTMRHQAMMK
jgi:hypothetical protein